MKIKIMESLGFKIIILYAILAVINISFIITIIFENQVDLISKNILLESEKQIYSLVISMKKFTKEIKHGILFRSKNDTAFLQHIISIIEPHSRDFIIFTDKGGILHRSKNSSSFPETFFQDGLRSVTTRTFTGKEYYLRIGEAEKKMYCYIPINKIRSGRLILLVRKDISGAGNALKNLYRQALFVIFVVLFFHLIFALVLYRSIILPINTLSKSSRLISQGDLYARVSIRRNDEIGFLANTFNSMAESINNNVSSLRSRVSMTSESVEGSGGLSIREELTGLYSRQYMMARLNEEIRRAARRSYSIGLLLVDIDHFKDINKIYGQQTGNIIIKEVAKIIQQISRDIDIVARFSGQEFAVIAPECTKKNIKTLGESIRETVEKKKTITPDGEFTVTVSIGGTSMNTDSLNTEPDSKNLISAVESALMNAKTRGRNRVEIEG